MAKQEPETSMALVASPVLGQMIGSDKATAAGITVRGPVPVLGLCRALLASGVDPNRPLHIYRGDVLALKVRTIGENAKLSVREDRAGPRFVPWEPFPRGVKPSARGNGKRGVGTAPDQENEPRSRPRATVGTRTLPRQRSTSTRPDWPGSAVRRCGRGHSGSRRRRWRLVEGKLNAATSSEGNERC
jgi:hypothetical protein